MGKIRQHPPVKFFSAVTYKPAFNLDPVINQLQEYLSSVDLISESYHFSSFTEYYNEEMGSDLKKIFLSFLKLTDAETLVSLKLFTNSLESEYSTKGNRTINIDPGYISQAKLVLATTKNYSHRIYLGQGIFGDLHQQFQNGRFTELPWTYPDYKSEANLAFFNKIRKRYLQQLGDIFINEI